jgi:tetratricopeptide (TPR) repeat protein
MLTFLYAILAGVVAVILGLLGFVSPRRRKLFWGLCVFTFFITAGLYWQQQKSAEGQYEEIKQALEKIASNTNEPPELAKVKEIAKKYGKTVEQLLAEFAKGSQFDRGLAALAEQKYDDAVQLFEKMSWIKKRKRLRVYFTLVMLFISRPIFRKQPKLYKNQQTLNPVFPVLGTAGD